MHCVARKLHLPIFCINYRNCWCAKITSSFLTFISDQIEAEHFLDMVCEHFILGEHNGKGLSEVTIRRGLAVHIFDVSILHSEKRYQKISGKWCSFLWIHVGLDCSCQRWRGFDLKEQVVDLKLHICLTSTTLFYRLFLLILNVTFELLTNPSNFSWALSPII